MERVKLGISNLVQRLSMASFMMKHPGGMIIDM